MSPIKASILLDVDHPEFGPGAIRGFRYFWAYYVSGFRPDQRCQACFKGERVADFCTATARSGRQVTFDQLDRYTYVYICGVGSGPKTELGTQNFHWALKYQENSVIEQHTYNGYVLTARNALALRIPALPDRWKGRDRETTRCKNFQFAVEYFGYPSR